MIKDVSIHDKQLNLITKDSIKHGGMDFSDDEMSEAPEAYRNSSRAPSVQETECERIARASNGHSASSALDSIVRACCAMPGLSLPMNAGVKSIDAGITNTHHFLASSPAREFYHRWLFPAERAGVGHDSTLPVQK
jgi:hypothetical protein